MKRNFVTYDQGMILNLIIIDDEETPPGGTIEVLPENMDEIKSLSGADKFFPDALILTPTLEEKARNYIDFGTHLNELMTAKMWARNVSLKYAGSALTATEMVSLLNQAKQFTDAVTTGSLDTAKYILSQLKVSLSQYADIADFGIAQINSYMGVVQ